MNKRDKIINEMKYKDLLDFNSMGNRGEGCAKYWNGVSYDHWRVMSDIVYLLKRDYKMKVFTEVIFKCGGRADIFAYNGTLVVILEILHSETEKKFNKKKDYYPKGIPIIKFNTESFKKEEFVL